MNKHFLFWIFWFSVSALAQDRLVNKAERNYEQKAYAYVSSNDLLDKLIQKKFNSSGIYAKLGDSYYFNADYKNALKAYNQINNLKDDYVLTNEQLFRYAQCLKSNGQFEEASKVIKMLNDKAGQEAINAGTEYLKEIEKQSNRFTIKLVSVNSDMPDYGVTFYKDNQAFFTSARDINVSERLKDRWNNKPYFKLYQAVITDDGDLTDAKMVKGKIKAVFHQSTPAVTKNGNQMYYTSSNFLQNKFGVDDTNTNRLRIYRATLVNGKWTNIEDLPFNDDSFSNAHPALRPDEKSLIFASDRPGTFGQTDLYEIPINDDGTFGEARNLGASINTIGRETFPSVSATGELYFASDGHSGLGGLDIFEAIGNSLDKDYKVLNVGKPINSPADDFCYVINTKTHKGFFTSNRTNDDQIYSFTELEPLKVIYEITVIGKVYDKKNNQLLPKTRISLVDANREKRDEYYTDDAGEYLIKVPVGDYFLTYNKIGYQQGFENVRISNTQKDQIIEIDKYLETDSDANKIQTQGDKIITDGSDLTNKLDLEPIYFDFTDSRIKRSSKNELNKVFEVLEFYPSMTVDVRSHTDSRGSKEFNLKLSERRAKATIEYLVNKGIKPSRITGRGYGETQLINKCKDGIKCSSQEHQLNRRSEFVISLNNK
ncbi:OmpA family protein [Flavobacterium foetidum]|uniref:OmpA family protein n=1 Tax=Flavobacterium foetidum TaxID=2026681 RepID=UPI001074F25E|nr:OmpA family protein [Flavobacterium foetidum]KAF2515548.1 OmpA family protein [Flavobacterium foetidum]